MHKRNFYEERKKEKAKKAYNKRCERRLRRQDTEARAEANTSHKTYQSPLEPESKGWMKQHIVNRVLGLWGNR